MSTRQERFIDNLKYIGKMFGGVILVNAGLFLIFWFFLTYLSAAYLGALMGLAFIGLLVYIAWDASKEEDEEE